MTVHSNATLITCANRIIRCLFGQSLLTAFRSSASLSKGNLLNYWCTQCFPGDMVATRELCVCREVTHGMNYPAASTQCVTNCNPMTPICVANGGQRHGASQRLPRLAIFASQSATCGTCVARGKAALKQCVCAGVPTLFGVAH